MAPIPMLTQILTFGIPKLCELLTNGYLEFHGLEDQVVELKSNLNLLSSFLQDATSKKHASAVVRTCLEEVMEIIFDAEDIIETFLIKEGYKRESGTITYITRLACSIQQCRDITSDIKSISKRISKVICDMQIFGVQQVILDGDISSHHIQERQRDMRQTFPMDNESNFVGLEENVKKIVRYLLEEANIQGVSITGMSGVGKTTLARHVFNHKEIKKRFYGIAWVCVSKDFKRRDVWQKIMRDLRPEVEENKVLQMNEDTLQHELFQLLQESKTLIVLDDIWKEDDWILIRHVFPAVKGCKVLLTSRNDNVIMSGNTSIFKFKLECLTTEDSWSLFQKIAFPIEDLSEFGVEMRKMAKQMIKHCGGLPLAIKVLGGLLANQHTLDEWKRIGENIMSHIIEGSSFSGSTNSSVYNILSLSFDELPIHLKLSFLFLAHYPEDHQINVENLSYYWAAEGFLKPNFYKEASIQDVGEVYIKDLVSRNMVLAKRDDSTLRFETCHLHDMMRDICLVKAGEANFLQIAGIPSRITMTQSLGPSRRFASTNPTSLDVKREINTPKLRSFLTVHSMPISGKKWRLSTLTYQRLRLLKQLALGPDSTGENIYSRFWSIYRAQVLPSLPTWGKRWMISGPTFKRLRLLRLLNLARATFNGGKLPESIGELIHLRYLSLYGAEVYHLPYTLRKLKLLIYLNLEVIARRPIFVPNVLMEMRELRYLALPRSNMDLRTKLEMHNLVYLETLINFSTKACNLEDLHGMTRLRKLGIFLTDENNIEKLYASIGGFRFLEFLEIAKREPQRTQEDGIVFDFNNLKILALTGLYMPSLPIAQHFSSNLTTIYLESCHLEEDPMPILVKFLHLKDVYLLPRSFSGKRMICSRDGFSQLRNLELWGLEELEEWIIEEGSMPLLQSLTLINCENLKELPDGLRFINAVKEMIIDWSWKERVSEGGEDYYKVQQISSVRLI